MKSKAIGLLAFSLAAARPVTAFSQSALAKPASVEIRVLEESGRPVANARAGATFYVGRRPGVDGEYLIKKGLTDDQGHYVSEGESFGREVHYGADKEGFYRTTGLEFDLVEKRNDRWEPWNPSLTVVLKRIRRPIPMYAKHVTFKMPADGTGVGFDLELGELTEPVGKGRKGDILFKIARTLGKGRDFEAILNIELPNRADGLLPQPAAKSLGSDLLVGGNAPEGDYQSKQTRKKGRLLNADGYDVYAPPQLIPAYYLRGRSVMDENGGLRSALYGKIYNDFQLLVGANTSDATVTFTYYLNPTVNDRDIEFDCKNNKLQGLSEFEKVSEP